MNKNDFIKSFKLKKIGSDLSESFKKGDMLTMFNNNYEVLSPDNAPQVILRDDKSICFAFPLEKLQSLIKKGVIVKKKGFIQKSFINKMKPLLKAKNVAQEGSRGGVIIGHDRSGNPIYMNHNINPSNPHHFHNEEGNPVHVKDILSSHENYKEHLNQYNEVNSKIANTHPKDREFLRSILNNFHKHSLYAAHLKNQQGKDSSKELRDKAEEHTKHAKLLSNAFKEYFSRSLRDNKNIEVKKVEPTHGVVWDPFKAEGLDKENLSREAIKKLLEKRGLVNNKKP